MRNSVRVKLTCIISGLIIVFVGLLWLSNGLFLKKFYYQNKEKTLLQVYSMLDNLPPEALESKSLDLERIENRSNLRIVLLDKEFKILYESMPGGRNNRRSQFYRNPEQRNRDVRTAPGQQNPPPRTSPPRTEDPRGADLALAAVLKEKLPQIKYGTPLLENRPDARLSTNFISLFAQTRDQNYVFITTSVPAIEESVALANKFFLVTGIIVIFLGGVLAYHISLRITRPILELDGIAKGMSNLDFSKKYTGKNNDEIGTLGHSINTMSEELERSIRELQEANAKLTDDIERERKIDEMRKEFISAVSHELKTPIALIQGYAEGLRMNVNEDEENKNYYCDVIMDEAVKMNKLVVTLLDLAQIESGNAHLDVAEFQINDLIEDLLKKNTILMKNKNITMVQEIEPNLLVLADYHKIEQVVSNYLRNALNHVTQNGVIKISATSIANKVRISVFNEGPSIPEESLEKIWTSFYKVDKARTRDYGGTGLGLSVVKSILTAHHNLCGVENMQNGVSFWFDLDKAEEMTK